MSQALPFREIKTLLPSIRERLRHIAGARTAENWSLADAIRRDILQIDNGLKITITKDGKVSLWHWPNPPFSDQFHYCNYGEFIANSEET